MSGSLNLKEPIAQGFGHPKAAVGRDHLRLCGLRGDPEAGGPNQLADTGRAETARYICYDVLGLFRQMHFLNGGDQLVMASVRFSLPSERQDHQGGQPCEVGRKKHTHRTEGRIVELGATGRFLASVGLRQALVVAKVLLSLLVLLGFHLVESQSAYHPRIDGKSQVPARFT